MNTILIHSESGDFDINDELIIKLRRSDESFIVTFFVDDLPVFSMGLEELPAFVETLSTIDC